LGEGLFFIMGWGENLNNKGGKGKKERKKSENHQKQSTSYVEREGKVKAKN